MRILIIEDVDWCANSIAEALKGLGDITVFTQVKVELESGFIDKRMPPLEKAVEAIKEADVVLLDEGLGLSYSGKQLLPYCGGKKVISISVSSIPGMVNWTEKLDLLDNKSLERNLVPHVAESLRNLVVETTS